MPVPPCVRRAVPWVRHHTQLSGDLARRVVERIQVPPVWPDIILSVSLHYSVGFLQCYRARPAGQFGSLHGSSIVIAHTAAYLRPYPGRMGSSVINARSACFWRE